MSLKNPRFAGQATLEAALLGAHRILARERDTDAVGRLQKALLDLGYDLPQFGPDGSFGRETGTAIQSFKRDRRIQPSDPVVGQKTMAAFDAETPSGSHSPPPGPDLRYWDRRSAYIGRAMTKAFPGGLPIWEPQDGFGANRATIVRVYDYYRDLYLARPDHFLWAGLAWMAGGAVVGGLDRAGPETVLTRIFVRIGRDIFLDLAWLHEAFLDDPALAVELAHLHDDRVLSADYALGEPPSARNRGPVESYGRAWERLAADDPSAIAEANRMLLANEQWSIIQPHYEFLLTTDEAGTFKRSRAFAENIHPYHRSFIEAFPQGDIRIAEDRWDWITESGGMLEKWIAAGTPERSRLVSLPFDAIIERNFGIPGRPDLLWPGSR